MTTDDDYSSAFGLQWNHYRQQQLDSYTGTTISLKRARRCLGDECWTLLHRAQRTDVLEVGCGAGRFTEVLLATGAYVTSVDLSCAVEANQQTCPQSDRHRVLQADALRLPFADGQYDVVFCLGVIQHTPNPEETIQRLYAQVKPGGWLVIDHYTYQLSYFTKTAPLVRAILRRLSPEEGLKCTERLVAFFFPLHRAVRNMRLGQVLLSRLSPVMVYYQALPLSDELQRQWALIDTHDSLTDWYKHFRTRRQIENTLRDMGMTDVSCKYAGNGVEARGRKPHANEAGSSNESKHYSRQGHLVTKEKIKSVLRRNTSAYKAAEVLYENSLYLPHILRQRLVPNVLGWGQTPSPLQARQSVLTWTVPIPPWNGPDDLINSLRSCDIRVVEGAHTLYIAPQPALRRLMPTVVDFYPDRCGFKILKTCADPLGGGYVYKNGRSLPFLLRLIGQPHDQLIPANYMFASGIGPRVHDLACWESEGTKCTVFVVDHLAGGRPTERQYRDFLNRLKELNSNSRLRILIPKWEENEDFAPPDCNGNLIYSDSRAHAQYVDFQNFGLTRSSDFQKEALLTARKATAEKTWAITNDVLHARSISVAGRVVLDFGCRSGITLGKALTAGAVWTVGWCEENLKQIEMRLFSWGLTRFSLSPNGSHADSFERDLPDHLRSRLPDAVGFWRANTNSRSQLESLLRLPWAALVCDYSEAEYALEDVGYLASRLPSTQFEVIPNDKPSLLLIIRRH